MSKSVYSKEYKAIMERLKTARIEAGLAQQEVAGKIRQTTVVYLKNRIRRKTA